MELLIKIKINDKIALYLVPNNYEELTRLIFNLFKSKNTKQRLPIHIFYKDNEEDLVTVSNNYDLEQAKFYSDTYSLDFLEIFIDFYQKSLKEMIQCYQNRQVDEFSNDLELKSNMLSIFGDAYLSCDDTFNSKYVEQNNIVIILPKISGICQEKTTKINENSTKMKTAEEKLRDIIKGAVAEELDQKMASYFNNTVEALCHKVTNILNVSTKKPQEYINDKENLCNLSNSQLTNSVSYSMINKPITWKERNIVIDHKKSDKTEISYKLKFKNRGACLEGAYFICLTKYSEIGTKGIRICRDIKQDECAHINVVFDISKVVAGTHILRWRLEDNQRKGIGDQVVFTFCITEEE